MNSLELKDDVEEWWNHNSHVIRQAGEEIFRKTSGKGPPNDKETWWWNEEVAECIKEKKEAKKSYYRNGNDANRERLKLANKAAKKAEAVAKAEAREDAYEELKTIYGEKKIFRIARARDRQTKDHTHIRHMNDENGRVLYDDDDVTRRWKGYIDKLLNEENARIDIGEGMPTERETRNITRNEVVKAMKKMKNNKSVGPDNIHIEVWKCLEEDGYDLMWDLVRKIFEQEMIPSEWKKVLLLEVPMKGQDKKTCR